MASSSQRTLPQSKEAQLRDYTMRLRSNVKAMFENFSEIIKLARVRQASVIFETLYLLLAVTVVHI
jgi:hypothetical protein